MVTALPAPPSSGANDDIGVAVGEVDIEEARDRGTMTDRASEQRNRLALLPYAVAAVIFIAIRFATNGTLGFHIDELYYMECGRHLSFGYVDYPPIVPILSRIETTVLGVSPWALRVLPALVGAVNVMIGAAYVRKLGGSLRLQALALLVGLTAPLLIGTFLFQTVVFDQLTWMVSLYLFLSIVLDRKPRTWILLGLTLGIGLEVKYLILPLILGMVIATLVTPSLVQTCEPSTPGSVRPDARDLAAERHLADRQRLPHHPLHPQSPGRHPVEWWRR